mmetsp:Transcript_4707/g.9862  ORF Transcript_4707/g.9862 Transcript_4707/m.9862 type:complete len:135 (-) Transcript_4707:160-564(-)
MVASTCVPCVSRILSPLRSLEASKRAARHKFDAKNRSRASSRGLVVQSAPLCFLQLLGSHLHRLSCVDVQKIGGGEEQFAERYSTGSAMGEHSPASHLESSAPIEHRDHASSRRWEEKRGKQPPRNTGYCRKEL